MVIVVLWLFGVRPACGQEAPASSASEKTQANQLPLSGRTGQTGNVKATQSPLPGVTTGVETVSPNIQVQGSYTGSTRGASVPAGTLSFTDAIRRGLEYNLGLTGQTQAVRQAQGQMKVARSTLLPNLSGYLNETVAQRNLRALGLGSGLVSPIPGFAIPSIVGPFNYFDVRATLTQTVLDLTARDNYRSANEIVRAAQLIAQDARELVSLAVGGVYLQVIATKAKLDSTRAQLETANALYDQALQQRRAGVVAQTDVNRSQIQWLTQQQRLLSLENDLAKQKISLARIIGLPLKDTYDISDDVPFSPFTSITLEDALLEAAEHRADLQAAKAQVRAAERALSAARAERLPALSVAADYGVIGTNPGQSHGTFNVAGNLRFPIWRGGRIEGNIAQAEAALGQRSAELEDIVGQIESDVRTAYLDMQTAASQVEVAQKNILVSDQNLTLTRQRFEEGVSDNVEVVQSQESVAVAQFDYINSVFAHNIAKLALARAMGIASNNFTRFLQVK